MAMFSQHPPVTQPQPPLARVARSGKLARYPSYTPTAKDRGESSALPNRNGKAPRSQ